MPHDRDFAAWAEEQAEGLRRIAAEHPEAAAELDLANLIDEVESMGASIDRKLIHPPQRDSGDEMPPGTITIRPFDRSMLEDFRALLQRSRATDGCWCMWHIIPVRDYHAGRGAQNERLFNELVEKSDVPMGLLAYVNGEAAGWVATGPRSRYARAIKTPTLQARDPTEDADVWLVSCFFVAREHRRQGLAGQLLDAAVGLAATFGAKAIEGFPTRGSRIATSDSQVGTEHLFARRGFETVRTPSSNRVIMRRDL